MQNHVIVAVALSLPTVVSSAVAQPASFSRDDYSSADGARAIVSADFDRNGRPDLAHANVGRNTVSVLLNDRGLLTHAFEVPVGAGPFALTTGDYDRDGIPDLAVANADGQSISILRGTGRGAFIRTDTPAPGQGPRGITTTDLNRDGMPDLIYTGYTDGRVQVLLGNGTGAFTAGAVHIGASSRPQGAVAGDFNGDGLADIAVAVDSSVGLRLFLGSSGNDLTPRNIGGHSFLNVLAVGDLDRDGRLDIAAASTRSSEVAVYLHRASGLTHAATYAVGLSPRGITIADVNGDGRLDVVTANRSSSTVSVLLAEATDPGSFALRTDVPVGRGSRAIAAADFDGDARVDLATGNEYLNRATVLRNITVSERAGFTFAAAAFAGAATLGIPSTLLGTAPAWDGRPLAVSDFDRDGKTDVVVRGGGNTEANSAVVLRGDGRSTILPGPAPFAGLVVADFDGDGAADVAEYAFDEVGVAKVLTHLGDGQGSFRAAPITTVAGLRAQGCAAADMDRDGRPDLVCGTTVLLGHGDGMFTSRTTAETSGAVQIADINRDGKPDAVLGPDIYYGDGQGELAHATTVATSATRLVRVADVNHDGFVDLLFGDGERVDVFLGGPAGYGAVPDSSYGSGLDDQYGDVAIGDINADGHADIVVNSSVPSESAGIAVVLFGAGDGTFADRDRFELPPGAVLVDDINGDGLSDLIAFTSDAVRVLVNERNDHNRPPVAPDYSVTARLPCVALPVNASDPDQHVRFVEWFDESGTQIDGGEGAFTFMRACLEDPGTYRFRRTVTDGHGGMATGLVTVRAIAGSEIVLYAAADNPGPGSQQVPAFFGNWVRARDASAAGGYRAYDTNSGALKVPRPQLGANYLQLGFSPDPTMTYKLWVRMKADNNSWANDSVWVQFSGSTDVAGTPLYRVGTTSGLAVNLEECLGCGVSGWGWEDDGWGAINKNGTLLRFPDGGFQEIYIETREDGVSIDQVVLSAEKYRTARPGAAKNDGTILPRTYPSW